MSKKCSKKNKIKKFSKKIWSKKKKICDKKFFFFRKVFDLKNTKNYIVKRKINIFSIGLQEMNPTIIPDPPVQYLRKCNFTLK